MSPSTQEAGPPTYEHATSETINLETFPAVAIKYISLRDLTRAEVKGYMISYLVKHIDMTFERASEVAYYFPLDGLNLRRSTYDRLEVFGQSRSDALFIDMFRSRFSDFRESDDQTEVIKVLKDIEKRLINTEAQKKDWSGLISVVVLVAVLYIVRLFNA